MATLVLLAAVSSVMLLIGAAGGYLIGSAMTYHPRGAKA